MARAKKDEGDARDRLVEAAGRGFRAGGFGGAGVDALAKRGGAHLGRVLRTFRFQGRGFQVVADSLALLRNGVIAFQERHWPQLARSLHRLLSRRTHAGCPR